MVHRGETRIRITEINISIRRIDRTGAHNFHQAFTWTGTTSCDHSQYPTHGWRMSISTCEIVKVIAG